MKGGNHALLSQPPLQPGTPPPHVIPAHQSEASREPLRRKGARRKMAPEPTSARAPEATLSPRSGHGPAARGLVEWPSKALSPSLCPRRLQSVPTSTPADQGGRPLPERVGNARPRTRPDLLRRRPESACQPVAGAVGARSPEGAPALCCVHPVQPPGASSVQLGPG